MNIRMYKTLAAVVLALLIVLVTPLSTMAQTHTNEVRMQAMVDALTDATLQEDCKGKSGHEIIMWGTRTYLNSCETDAIIILLKDGGTGTGALAALLGAMGKLANAPVYVLAAALAHLGGVALDSLHTSGGKNGIYIDIKPQSVMPPHVISSIHAQHP